MGAVFAESIHARAHLLREAFNALTDADLRYIAAQKTYTACFSLRHVW